MKVKHMNRVEHDTRGTYGARATETVAGDGYQSHAPGPMEAGTLS